MTRSERDRLRSEALRLLVEAAISAGGDLGFPRSPIVKALLRQGASRSFAYDIITEVLEAGEAEAELARRGLLRCAAEKRNAADQAPEASGPAPINLSGAAVAQALALLDRAGELVMDACDHADDAGQTLLIQAMKAAEDVEALLRGQPPGEASA